MSKSRIALTAVLALIAVGGVLVAIAAMGPVKPAMWGSSADAPQEKRWQAVAPGRVEACSGQIKVAAATIGVVHKVLVKANDKVFAGEPLIQLADDELRARLAAAETQVAMRERARDEKSATGSAKTRRKAQDAVAEAERTLYDARSAVDRTAARLRAKGGSEADLTAARTIRPRPRVTALRYWRARLASPPTSPSPKSWHRSTAPCSRSMCGRARRFRPARRSRRCSSPISLPCACARNWTNAT